MPSPVPTPPGTWVPRPGTPYPPELQALGRRVLQDLPALTQRLVTMILEADAGYGGPGVSLEDLTGSCHENLRRLLETVTSEVASDEDRFDAPRRTGRRRGRQGLALEDLLRSYRLGGLVLWEAVAAVVQDDPDVSEQTLVDAATWVWEVVDLFSSEVAGAYREYQAERTREDFDRQRLLLEALLDGRGTDPLVRAEAAAALGLPETGAFRVLVTPTPGTRDAQGSSLLPDVGGLRTVTLTSTGQLSTVVDLGAAPDDADHALRRSLTGPAGLSPRVGSLGQLGPARRLAETALRTVRAGTADVAWVDERLPDALVARSPDLAALLVQGTLGPLLALEPTEREPLVATIEAYLAHGGSTSRAAVALVCHRNTVLNRLHRLEGLLGHSVNDLSHLVDVSLAVRALRLSERVEPCGGPCGRWSRSST